MKTQFEQMIDGLNDVEAFLAVGSKKDSRRMCPRKLT